MPRSVGIEAVVEALGQVAYPGYDSDIVSLGVVEDVTSLASGSFSITLRQATDKQQVMRELDARIGEVLERELGLTNFELKANRLEPELGLKTGRVRLQGVRHIVAVASGKGGVGKSTVAANLAVALNRLDQRVGLLDADIYGPSMGLMFGVGEERPRTEAGNRFHPISRYGVELISMAFFLNDKAPVIWRGPMVMGAVRQFLKDTLWGELDFLVVDLPPGTGDAQLTLAQQVALDGAVIVTTPQEVALLDAQRAVRMLQQVHCPILGVVENMSLFVCPDCGEVEEIFGAGGGERMARQEHTKLLGRLPLFAEVRESGDLGVPIVQAQPDHPASRIYRSIAQAVISTVVG